MKETSPAPDPSALAYWASRVERDGRTFYLSASPSRVAARYLRATFEVDESWVAERTRALEEILLIPVDGGDWEGCARPGTT